MTTVEVLGGRAVLVRRGGDELRREARILEVLAGPGVPEVVALDDDGDEVRLVTAVQPRLLLLASDVAAIAAQLARILARAHDAGIVHGPVRDEHLYGRPDAVVLGGWHEAGPGDASTDVAELGRFVKRHAGTDPTLLALAERALAPEPPAMGALTAAPAIPPPPSLRRPNLPTVGLVVAAVVLITGAMVSSGDRRGATMPLTTTLPTTTTTSTQAPETTTTAPGPVVRVSGNVVERGGERWTVGQPGDVVVVGDWHCDRGDPVPAVLRPSTGQVWIFDTWSASGEPVAGRTLATVPGAIELRVERAGRCDRLVAVDAQGATSAVG